MRFYRAHRSTFPYNARVVLGGWLSFGAVCAPAVGQFPSVLDVELLDGTNGFTVYGTVLGEFGQEVAGVGDVDADGIDDLMTGGDGVVWNDLCECVPTPGACQVLWGNAKIGQSGTWTADQLRGQWGFYIPGLDVPDNAGRLAPAGDFNNDGIADMLMGAPFASAQNILFSGEAYVIYGGSLVGAKGSVDLAALNGRTGFLIEGIHALGNTGAVVAGLGDINFDGIDDIAVASDEGDPGGRIDAGQVYMLFGGTDIGQTGTFSLGDLALGWGVTFNGINPGDRISRVYQCGDVNGDGVSDLLIHSWYARPQPGARGQAYVVYGGPQMTSLGEMELADLDGSNGFIINGPVGADLMSPVHMESAIGIGDINDDRYMDLGFIVADPHHEGFVVFGGPSVAPDGLLTLPEVNGDNGFRFVAPSGVVRLAPAGDFNHDAIDDVFVPGGNGIQVVFGRPGLGAAGTIDVSQLDWRDRARFTTSISMRAFAPAGDVNSDGLADFAIGFEWEFDYFTNSDLGGLHVIFGRRMGDSDLDADVDLDDYAAFVACRTPPTPGDVPDPCHPFDFDKDLDVDLLDYAAFQRTLATPP